MPLEESRKATQSLLLTEPLDEPNVVEMAKQWFAEFKQWERDETFDRAYQAGRMTARVAKVDVKPTTFPVMGSDGQKTHKVVLNNSAMGLKSFIEPTNFLAKQKNEMGLHDFSAVLVKPATPISAQVFVKAGVIVFMPLPEDADLRLVHYMGVAAKKSKTGALYSYYVEVRNSMTRIKYGSPEDMSNGFYWLDKGDGKDHFRYGLANIMGGTFGHSSPIPTRGWVDRDVS